MIKEFVALLLFFILSNASGQVYIKYDELQFEHGLAYSKNKLFTGVATGETMYGNTTYKYQNGILIRRITNNNRFQYLYEGSTVKYFRFFAPNQSVIYNYQQTNRSARSVDVGLFIEGENNNFLYRERFINKDSLRLSLAAVIMYSNSLSDTIALNNLTFVSCRISGVFDGFARDLTVSSLVFNTGYLIYFSKGQKLYIDKIMVMFQGQQVKLPSRILLVVE